VHKITLPANPAHLATFHSFLTAEVPEAFKGSLNKIEMAVEELLMNVFHYAYEDTPEIGGEAEIGCQLVFLDDKTFFRITLRDWGRPYNPFTEAPVPDLKASLEERPIGGLGLHIVKKIVAHYAYSRHQNINDVELFFAPDKR
jgi:anti-sigma regulatory factor (Ser/Thr protein kinase)